MIRLLYILSSFAVAADEQVTVVKLSDWRIDHIGKRSPALIPLLDKAKPAIGTPYTWGGTRMGKGIDCSNFTWQVYRSVGDSYERSNGGHNLPSKKSLDFDLIYGQDDG